MQTPPMEAVEHLGVRWEVPADWTEATAAAPVPGVTTVLRGPAAPGGFASPGGIAPTAVLTIHDFPGTLTQLSTVNIATWTVLYPDLHVLAVDEYRGGRRIEATATQGGVAMHFTHVCSLVDGYSLGLTVTCEKSALPWLDRTIGTILASLRFPEQAVPVQAPRYGWVPDRAPTAAAGHRDAEGRPVERLDDFNRRQRWVSAGPSFGPEELGILRRLMDSGRGLGRLERSAAAGPLGALEAAGLCDDRGVLTPGGSTVVAPMREAETSVRVITRRGERTSILQLWRGGHGGTTVLAGPDAAAQWGGDPAGPWDDRQTLDMVQSGTEAAVIAAWVGAGPTWPVLSADVTVLPSVMGRLVEGEPVAADDLPDALRGQELMAWSVQPGPDRAPALFLNIGGLAHAEVVREQDRAVLVPIGSRNLYRRLRLLVDPGLGVHPR